MGHFVHQESLEVPFNCRLVVSFVDDYPEGIRISLTVAQTPLPYDDLSREHVMGLPTKIKLDAVDHLLPLLRC